MYQRIEIGKRIKKLRQKHNFSQTQVAEVLFISQAAYSLIENSQNGIVAEHIIKLSRLYKVSADYILTGDDNYIRVGRDSGFVPLLRARAHTGFLKNLDNDSYYNIKDWYRVPGFDSSENQMLIEAKGKSMVPTILPGDILFCQVCDNLDNIPNGSSVAVVTVDGIMIKRLRKDEDESFVVLENDNEAEGKPRKLKKQEIKMFLLILGKISRLLIPQEEIEGGSRMRDLEESVGMLKEQLNEMNENLGAITSKNK